MKKKTLASVLRLSQWSLCESNIVGLGAEAWDTPVVDA